MKNEDYNNSLEFLRTKFVEENEELLKKIEKSKKTGTFQTNYFEEIYIKDFLEVFELSNFFFPELLQLYEELLYLYNFVDADSDSITVKDYCDKDGVVDIKRLKKDVEDIAKIINARKILEKHVRQLAKGIGIKKLKLDEKDDDDFISLKQYLKAIESGKKKTLSHSGDFEFLVSKIPINNKGFIYEDSLRINNKIFYTFKSEQIIEMARVSNPGIYLIANIPYDKYVNAGFYILFVTKGDSYLVDNNLHCLRDFITRNEDRLMEHRTQDTFLPWEIISNFLEKKSDDKSLINKETDFSFSVIGDLSDVNHTDIFGLTAFLDTCIYTFTKTDFLNDISVAMKIAMMDKTFLKNPDNKSLIVYKENIPLISSMDLNWDSEKFDLPEENAGSYLVPYLKEFPIEKINTSLVRDELSSLEQVEKKLTYLLRKQAANELEEKIKKDYSRNWKKVKEWLKLFVQNKFSEKHEYFIKKILEDREYSYRKYKTFSSFDGNQFEGNSVLIKEKILTTIFEHKTVKVRGRGGNWYSMSDRNFHFKSWIDFRKEYYPCAHCEKNGKTEYVLTISDVQQFIEFFELTKVEVRKLPKQMIKYLNQARNLYDGNSILDDLDPISQIYNPWWVSSGSEPYITLSMALCGFCKKKFNKLIEKKD